MRLSPVFSLRISSPCFLASAPPALSRARVVCFCYRIVAIMSCSVVLPSHRSIAIA
jgi:hypothetical protein